MYMKKLTASEYAKEDEILKSLYNSGISACEISKQSEKLLGRKLGVSRITTRLKHAGVSINTKVWNKGVSRENDTTGRMVKWQETFLKNTDSHRKYGHKLSEETKQKISNSRKEFLRKNPNKVGYRLNHSSKESYPEKYFHEVFKKEGINLERYFRIGLYELDFCCLESKIDIEIDGGTHKQDNVKEKDQRRDQCLKQLGWKVIRIDWSSYQKLNIEQKQTAIKDILKNFQ